MSTVKVRNAVGALVWESPPAGQPLVEVVEQVVRVTDLDNGQVIATYPLKPGERVSQ